MIELLANMDALRNAHLLFLGGIGFLGLAQELIFPMLLRPLRQRKASSTVSSAAAMVLAPWNS